MASITSIQSWNEYTSGNSTGHTHTVTTTGDEVVLLSCLSFRPIYRTNTTTGSVCGYLADTISGNTHSIKTTASRAQNYRSNIQVCVFNNA